MGKVITGGTMSLTGVTHLRYRVKK